MELVWTKIEYAAKIDTNVFPNDATMKPTFRPVMLINLDAKIAPIAIPTTEIDIGKVDKDFNGLICDPIIPLKKTVTGAAVKLKIWLKVKTIRFLFINYISTFGRYNHWFSFQLIR